MRSFFIYTLICVGFLQQIKGADLYSSATVKVHMTGDSTMANKPIDTPNPERGWGQLFPECFKDPSVVINYAVNGRSTKSFIDEGKWAKVIAAIKPGDYLIIQFGHNDEKKDKPLVYAAPYGAYTDNLKRFIAEARAHKAIPILATPVARRKFDKSGKLVDTHGDYPTAVRELAKKEHVPLLDLLILTSQKEQALGVEDSKKIHLWIAPGVYARDPKGLQDDTHYSELGARLVSSLAAEEIKRQNLPLAELLK